MLPSRTHAMMVQIPIGVTAMAENPQDYSHHTRWDPAFPFFLMPGWLIPLIQTIIHTVRRPGMHSAWMIVLAVALILLALKSRQYAVKVQDRVIRLEERLRP